MNRIVCPDCGLPLAPGPSEACPHCRLPLSGPDAAALWEVSVALWGVEQQRAELLRQREALLGRLRARRGLPAAVKAPEVSRRSVQTVLLVLGGLLVSVAALLFAVVNWGSLGPGGRTAVLLTLTAGALALPPVLRRGGLSATAEAAGGIGLGLGLLDFLAARPGTGSEADEIRYWAVALGFLGVAALAYGLTLRLRFALAVGFALLRLPVPLLLLAAGGGQVQGYATAAVAATAVDLALLWAAERNAVVPRPLWRVGVVVATGWALAGGLLAAVGAAWADSLGEAAWAWAPLGLLAGLALAVARRYGLAAYALGAALVAAAGATLRQLLPSSWAAVGYGLSAAVLLATAIALHRRNGARRAPAAEPRPADGAKAAPPRAADEATPPHAADPAQTANETGRVPGAAELPQTVAKATPPRTAEEAAPPRTARETTPPRTAGEAGPTQAASEADHAPGEATPPQAAEEAAPPRTARETTPPRTAGEAGPPHSAPGLRPVPGRGGARPAPVAAGLLHTAWAALLAATLPAVPGLAAAVAAPLRRAVAVWFGVGPATLSWHVAPADVTGLGLLAAALAVHAASATDRATARSSPAAVAAAVLGALLFGLLPVVWQQRYDQAVSTALFLLLTTGAAVLRRNGPSAAAKAALGSASAVALVWASADRGATVTALGICVVLGALLTWRVGTALAATTVLALAAEALAVADTAGLPAADLPFAVLAVALPAAALRYAAAEITGCLLTAAALIALAPEPGRLALALAVTGVAALALAIRPDRRTAGTVTGLGLLVAASWVWLTLRQVGIPEAYTAGLAVAALTAGHLRYRRDPAARSWPGHGPGLALALLPSTLALWADGHWLRPLLLGTAALAATAFGVRRRLQAPLVLGGGALLVTALHELAPAVVQVLGLLPRWAPLAAAGLLLLALGARYERRLHDARRLREAFRQFR
ncbi:hypothetical protein ABT095_37250 [Kitasatospora sp. NPDC002227]|uniref:SCO7613 C-terminal domain-containing membrane protein n=1 Tax=Kitasatospora sp. NPDC002227 TaxID=3154773 RepID=UPI00331C8604